MCKAHGIFDIIPTEERSHSHCPFKITDSYATKPLTYYVTSGCLVYKSGIFYDPCKLGGCQSHTDITLNDATQLASQVNFQLPDMVDAQDFGVLPDHYDGAPTVDDAVNTHPTFTKAFHNRVVVNGSTGAGNTVPGKSWGASEGVCVCL